MPATDPQIAAMGAVYSARAYQIHDLLVAAKVLSTEMNGVDGDTETALGAVVGTALKMTVDLAQDLEALSGDDDPADCD